MMEGTGKDLALSNASHGDADSAEKYGKLLYSLSAQPKSGQCLTETMVMKFYQDVIVFQLDSTFCWCCPKFYQQKVYPKYKLKDIHVSKGDPSGYIFWGLISIIISSALITESGGAKDAGIAFLVIGLILWICPWFCTTYDVHFRFTDKKDFGMASLCRDLLLPGSFSGASETVKTNDEPNGNFLFDYCYGSLGRNMDEMHLLHHLIHDDITQVVRPDAFDDITDKSSLIPNAVEAGGGSGNDGRDISSAKFGSPVFKLTSEVTGSILASKTNVAFFDQVVVFQEEKQILCWPMWFNQRVVPKYKFKSFNISKDDPIFATMLGLFCVVIGAIFIAAKLSKGFGGLMIFFGLVCWIIPFVFSTYQVHFILTHQKDFGLSRVLRDCLPCVRNDQSEMITIRMSVQPDEAQIKAYVFGPVVKNMETIHTLNHLIHDDIVEVMAPTKLNDVCL
jgi:hypothetical protein